MKTQKRRIGLSGDLWIACAALLLLLPLAWFDPALGGLALAIIALIAAFLLHRRARALAASHEKLSGEIDVLSQHLLKVEALATAAAEWARPTTPSSPAPETTPLADIDALATSVDDIAAEIGLLSGIVRELAAVVAAQDGEIARLKTKAPEPPTKPEPVRASPPPSSLPEVAVLERPVPPIRPSTLPKPAPVAAPAPAPEPTPSDPAREAALIEAFDGGGLEIWLQPVVTLPQRKVVSYEALARLRLGPGEAAVLSPETFMPVLERHGRTTALDRRMLKGTATIARHLQGRGSPAAVAYALSPQSLFEPEFLRSLGGLIGTDAALDGRLALALPQASWRNLDREQKAVLGELRGRVGFILDRPTDLRFEAAALGALGIGQVKVPASLLLRPAADAQPDIAVEDLVAALGRSGIRLAACSVEREADVPDLIDLDVPLAQGLIFASPRAVRTDVLSAPPAATSVPEPPSQPDPEPPPQRRPFRDFLRRAV